MGVQIFVTGQRACFTRPELNVERVSYDVPTPSAAIGILEAIHWKPAIQWHVDRITVYEPIRWMQWRTNEVKLRASRRRSNINAPAARIQRTTQALRDVAYLIEAHFVMTDKVGADDTTGKHLDIFNRRVKGRQCWQRPSLGLREMVVDDWLPEPDREVDASLVGERDLGLMLHSIDHATGTPRWFRASMRDGVINVPSVNGPEVYQ